MASRIRAGRLPPQGAAGWAFGHGAWPLGGPRGPVAQAQGVVGAVVGVFPFTFRIIAGDLAAISIFITITLGQVAGKESYGITKRIYEMGLSMRFTKSRHEDPIRSGGGWEIFIEIDQSPSRNRFSSALSWDGGGVSVGAPVFAASDASLARPLRRISGSAQGPLR